MGEVFQPLWWDCLAALIIDPNTESYHSKANSWEFWSMRLKKKQHLSPILNTRDCPYVYVLYNVIQGSYSLHCMWSGRVIWLHIPEISKLLSIFLLGSPFTRILLIGCPCPWSEVNFKRRGLFRPSTHNGIYLIISFFWSGLLFSFPGFIWNCQACSGGSCSWGCCYSGEKVIWAWSFDNKFLSRRGKLYLP